jgi:hypothetical protein
LSQIRWIHEHHANSILDRHDAVPVVHPVQRTIHYAFVSGDPAEVLAAEA